MEGMQCQSSEGHRTVFRVQTTNARCQSRKVSQNHMLYQTESPSRQEDRAHMQALVQTEDTPCQSSQECRHVQIHFQSEFGSSEEHRAHERFHSQTKSLLSRGVHSSLECRTQMQIVDLATV